jgi:hypothetical protein
MIKQITRQHDDSPCIGCLKFWYAGRNCSCQDMCDELARWRKSQVDASAMKRNVE